MTMLCGLYANNEGAYKQYNYEYPYYVSSYHVDRIAAKNEKNQSATVIQNTRTVVNLTDLFDFHWRTTSLMISEPAMNDSVPPTLGMIAMDFAKGE
jgi:hypothetical protein